MTHDELLYGIKEIERLAEGMWGTNALRAVVELHKPMDFEFDEDEIVQVCSHCQFGVVGHRYPCETIQAIEKEMSGNG